MQKQADYWIKELGLIAHPEGGYYKEIYRNDQVIRVFDEERNLATSIYFLIKENHKSHFHQLESDELWYFHAGTAAIVHILENGTYRKEVLGSDITNGESLQILLPAKCIFAAEVKDKTSYCLMGCMVNPGFDFKDFRLVGAEELLMYYPEQAEIINEFTLL